jgi:hypothetical protein
MAEPAGSNRHCSKPQLVLTCPDSRLFPAVTEHGLNTLRRDGDTRNVPIADEKPASVSAACGKCGLPLDESPSTPPDKRRPCPRCGSKSRRFGVELHSTVKVTASLAMEVVRKDVIERHWPWLLVLLAGTVTSAVVGGLVVSGWVSVAASLAFASSSSSGSARSRTCAGSRSTRRPRPRPERPSGGSVAPGLRCKRVDVRGVRDGRNGRRRAMGGASRLRPAGRTRLPTSCSSARRAPRASSVTT